MSISIHMWYIVENTIQYTTRRFYYEAIHARTRSPYFLLSFSFSFSLTHSGPREIFHARCSPPPFLWNVVFPHPRFPTFYVPLSPALLFFFNIFPFENKYEINEHHSFSLWWIGARRVARTEIPAKPQYTRGPFLLFFQYFLRYYYFGQWNIPGEGMTPTYFHTIPNTSGDGMP